MGCRALRVSRAPSACRPPTHKCPLGRAPGEYRALALRVHIRARTTLLLMFRAQCRRGHDCAVEHVHVCGQQRRERFLGTWRGSRGDGPWHKAEKQGTLGKGAARAHVLGRTEKPRGECAGRGEAATRAQLTLGPWDGPGV